MELLLQILTILITFIVTFFLFSITVLVHEAGHLLGAKRKGMVVERFAIGFGPKALSWKHDGIEYVLNWLPFGGFVQLPQMAEMEMVEGKSELATQDLPPATPWAKIVAAFWGPLFSFLLALVAAVLVYFIGVPQNQTLLTTTVGYVEPDSPAAKAGIQPGDKILSIDGKEMTRWAGGKGGVLESVILSVHQQVVVDVERGDEIHTFEITPEKDPKMENLRVLGFEHYNAEPLTINRVFENSPAEQAGLQKGDEILSVDGSKLFSPIQLKRIVETSSQPLELTYLRKGQTTSVTLKATEVSGQEYPMIGILWNEGEVAIVHIDPWTQIYNSLTFIYKTLKAIGSPQSDVGVRHLSGPLGIFDKLMSLLTADPRLVLYFTVILNVNLAVINLMPIPILDGGHIMFSVIEAMIRKPLQSRFIHNIQMTFFFLLIGLFIFVTFNDAWRIGKRVTAKEEKVDLPIFQKQNNDSE